MNSSFKREATEGKSGKRDVQAGILSRLGFTREKFSKNEKFRRRVLQREEDQRGEHLDLYYFALRAI